MAELKVGDIAPEFDLPRDGGGQVKLTDYRGRPLVLYFYPKDDTTGCTVESVDFSSRINEFEAAGAAVLGMSPDSPKSHDKFVKKHSLGVVLASDEAKTTLEAYGVWKEKSMYGKTYMGVERTTFLLDADGKVAKIWTKVKVADHAQEVLEAVKAM